MVNLVETKIYYLRVGLFCFPYNEKSNRLFGSGTIALLGSTVFYDHYEKDKGHIFTVLENKMAIIVPDGYEDDHISEEPLDDDYDEGFIELVKEYNSKIEACNG